MRKAHDLVGDDSPDDPELTREALNFNSKEPR